MADMVVDLEKQAIEDGVDAPAPILAIEGGGQQEPLIQIEGGVGAAAKVVNSARMKYWMRYWTILVFAASFIVLPDGRDDHTAPQDDHLVKAELPMFVMFLCAIWLVIRTVKQMS